MCIHVYIIKLFICANNYVSKKCKHMYRDSQSGSGRTWCFRQFGLQVHNARAFTYSFPDSTYKLPYNLDLL